MEEEEEKTSVTTRTFGGAAEGGKPSAVAAPVAGGSTLPGGPGRPAAQTSPSSTIPAGTRSFETDMVLANRVGDGGGEVVWAWVR